MHLNCLSAAEDSRSGASVVVADSGDADDVRSDELNVHASSSRMGQISERRGKSEGVCREFDGLALGS